MKPTLKQLQDFAAYVEELSHLPLVERVLLWIRYAKLRGLEREVFARPAHYLAVASGSATAAEYTIETTQADPGGENPTLLLTEIEHPADGTADILCSSIRCNGNEHVDVDVLADAWCDARASEDARALPWPIIVPGTPSKCILKFSGTNMNTTGLKTSGFHVDRLTRDVFRYVGELALEGFNKTYSAAAIMAEPLARKHQLADKELSHVVSKETLTGDTARNSVKLLFRTIPIVPREHAVIPPLSLRKAGARVQVGVRTNDTTTIESRYTSAGGAGTAKLQITTVGRRRYTLPDCA